MNATERLTARCRAFGSTGAVASSSPQAAAVGTMMLKHGGNCVDAALAAAMVETVVLAPKCGLAGDVVALHLRPGADRPDALVAVGPGPARLAGAVTSSGKLAATGAMSVGVPGAPAGYAQLAQLCSLPLSELVAPAISIAEQGFAWSALCTMLAAEADDLLVANQPDGCHYRPASGPLAHNALVRLPGLARVLEAFVERRETLFHGSLGEALVRRVAAAGGVLEMDDLLRASALWSEPASLCSPGAPTIWTTPGPTYGPALLSVLAEHHKERGAELARSVQQVLADQARLGRVPDFWRTDGTSVVTAADTDGGAVVIVHSNSFPQFGSGLVVDELDLVLSNRAGRGFSADPSSENFPSHTRRPLTTLHAWAIGTKRPQLLGGTAGGVQQVAWNAQVLTSLLGTELRTDMAPERRAPDLASPDLASPDLASAVAAAIVAPLWCLEGEHIIAEPDESMESGDNVTFIEPLTMRSTQVVAMPGGHDAMASAWADPRHEAIALAI